METGKRVLVTGLSGFTGKHLSAELERHGYVVYGIGSYPDASLVHYRQVDLEDMEALKAVVREIRPNYVVHLAAIAFVGHSDANAFYRVNVIGTRNLLEALAPYRDTLHRVLLASSANIYGNATEGCIDEATLPNPANDYAVSKLAMEYMARLWFARLPIVITRPFNYTGVGQAENFLLPKIIAYFRAKAPRIELGNLDVQRDFSDVRSVVSAYRKLLEAAPSGETVNVCSGRLYSLRDALALAQQLSGHSLEVRVNPEFVRANEVKTLYGDPARLRRLIGEWSSIELRDTLAWMLEQGPA